MIPGIIPFLFSLLTREESARRNEGSYKSAAAMLFHIWVMVDGPLASGLGENPRNWVDANLLGSPH